MGRAGPWHEELPPGHLRSHRLQEARLDAAQWLAHRLRHDAPVLSAGAQAVGNRHRLAGDGSVGLRRAQAVGLQGQHPGDQAVHDRLAGRAHRRHRRPDQAEPEHAAHHEGQRRRTGHQRRCQHRHRREGGLPGRAPLHHCCQAGDPRPGWLPGAPPSAGLRPCGQERPGQRQRAGRPLPDGPPDRQDRHAVPQPAHLGLRPL